MAALPFTTKRKPAGAGERCGFPCVFNLKDKDYPNVGIYPIKTGRN
jgi:hypothetical protein